MGERAELVAWPSRGKIQKGAGGKEVSAKVYIYSIPGTLFIHRGSVFRLSELFNTITLLSKERGRDAGEAAAFSSQKRPSTRVKWSLPERWDREKNRETMREHLTRTGRRLHEETGRQYWGLGEIWWDGTELSPSSRSNKAEFSINPSGNGKKRLLKVARLKAPALISPYSWPVLCTRIWGMHLAVKHE